MLCRRAVLRHLSVILVAGVCLTLCASRQMANADVPAPSSLSYTYRVDWGVVNAGDAVFDLKDTGDGNWRIDLNIESIGVVNRLYKVSDKYQVSGDGQFCPASVSLDAIEGKKHQTSQLKFDAHEHTVDFREHDLIRNTDSHNTLTVPPCTHDIASALASFHDLDLQPGKDAFLSITDGKKVASVKVQAQAREQLHIADKTFPVVRYEAFLFNNVLYKHKGRLFIWVTDDAHRLPIQMRLQLGFPIGNIQLELENPKS